MPILLPGERARLDALRVVWPITSLWRHAEDSGAVYALVTQRHSSNEGRDTWTRGRALYVNLSTGETFDRAPDSFGKRFAFAADLEAG